MGERTQQPYNDQAIKYLTKQVKGLLRDIVTDQAELRRKEPVVDAKPLSVWVLKTDDLGSDLQKGKDLLQLAKDTKRWHHQIRLGTSFLAYARSAKPTDVSVTKKPGPTDVSLTKLSVSPLAKKIHDALEQLKKVKTEVRLLTVPASNVNALWWTEGGKSKFKVLRGRFTKELDGIDIDEALDSQTFVRFVKKQLRVGGLNLKP